MKSLIVAFLFLGLSSSVLAKSKQLDPCGSNIEQIYGVNMEHYEKLKPGMTEKEVTQILGCYGKEVSSSADILIEKYEVDGRGITVVYSRNRLSSKSNFGF